MAVMTADAAGTPASRRGADAQALLTRMESVPFSLWHMRARVIMGSATFFDAFDALSIAFVLPVLVRLWQITPAQVGWLVACSSRNGGGTGLSGCNHLSARVFHLKNPIGDAPTIANEREPISHQVRHQAGRLIRPRS